jgi:hypothetical protein
VVLVAALPSFLTARAPRSRLRIPLAGVLVLMLAIMFLLPLGQAGAGWSYSRGQISINTGFGQIQMAARRTGARWVTHNPAYQLAVRTGGTSTSHLKTGHFRLSDGRPADVFEYQPGNRSNPVLALTSHHVLVLLASPGVKRLERDLHRTAGSPNPTGYLPPHAPAFPWGVLAAAAAAITALAAHAVMARRFAPQLPDQVYVHFGLSGKPNRAVSRRTVLFIGPVISLTMGIVGMGAAASAPGILNAAIFVLPAQLLMIWVSYGIYRVNIRRQLP